jgi:hypothetical protein
VIFRDRFRGMAPARAVGHNLGGSLAVEALLPLRRDSLGYEGILSIP